MRVTLQLLREGMMQCSQHETPDITLVTNIQHLPHTKHSLHISQNYFMPFVKCKLIKNHFCFK